MKPGQPARKPLVLNGRWMFDPDQDQLLDLQHGAMVSLGPAESRLLRVFAASALLVLPPQQLINAAWRNIGLDADEEELAKVIRGLSDLFARLPSQRPHIRTIPRIGYVLLADVSEADAG